MMEIWNSFLRWFDQTAFWRFISKNIVAHLTFRMFGYPEFNWSRSGALRRSMLEDGYAYAFVSCDTRSLAALLIRGLARSRWTHAGIVIGDRVYEMKGKGLLIHNMGYVLSQTDNLAIVRFHLDEMKMELFNSRIDELERNSTAYKYDFSQRLDGSPNALYCSELVYALLRDLVEMKEPEWILGRYAFSPDSVYHSGEIVFEHIVR